MICDDCGREMVRKGDYNPPVWKCYHCNVEVEEDEDFEDKQVVYDEDKEDRV